MSRSSHQAMLHINQSDPFWLIFWYVSTLGILRILYHTRLGSAPFDLPKRSIELEKWKFFFQKIGPKSLQKWIASLILCILRDNNFSLAFLLHIEKITFLKIFSFFSCFLDFSGGRSTVVRSKFMMIRDIFVLAN